MSLNELAHSAMATDWVAGACITCLIYDHVLTLSQEISGIWWSRFSISKVLFFLNRYVVAAMIVFNGIASQTTHLSSEVCVFYLRWLVVTVTVAMAVIEGILVLRIWALYRTHKLVLFVVFFSYTACIATLVGLTISDYVAENVIIETELNFLPGCYAAGVPRLIAGYWIAPVVVESIFFALTISRTFAWIRNRESVPPTLGLLARDSLVYFAVVFVLLIANLLVFEYAPPTLSSLLVTPSNTAGCIAGSRMLLNLRNSFSRRPPQTADMELSLRPDLPEYHVARTPRKYGDPTLTYSERSDYTFGSGKDSVKGRLSGVEEA